MKRGLRFYCNILIVILAFGSWLGVFFFGNGSLLQNGFGALRYFTLQSNIFAGAVAVAWLASAGKSEDGRASDLVEKFKYVAAAGLTVRDLGEAVTYEEAELVFLCKKVFYEDMITTHMPAEIVQQHYTPDEPHTLYIGEVVDIIRK